MRTSLGRVSSGVWGIVWGVGVWLYAWSLGVWALELRNAVDFVPLVVAATLSAMVLDHFGFGRWPDRLLTVVFVLVALPVVDLMVDPGCAGVDYLEVYETDDGSADVRCTRMASIGFEAAAAAVGLAVAGALAVLLARRRSR